MASFHNVRLPVNVERGAKGGPGFKTTITPLSSGFEQRNIEWSRTRGKWDISYGVDTITDLEAVIAFFHTRFGRAYGFRFKDWTDFKIGNASTSTIQPIATADGILSEFQAVRRYSDGTFVYNRPITRLVSGTYSVYLNGGLQTETTHYTIDVDTGVITFVSTPSASDIIGLIAEFDVPVRFDQDDLDITAFLEDAGEIGSIDIIEIRERLQTLS
jgi:uncharacterized protein (TIGR02217 family)